MKIAGTVPDVRREITALRQQGQRIAFVPTMGNLHDGHLQLIKTAQQHGDAVVVSIFVNPLQFGANEDFDAYPRTLQQDQAKLQALSVDLLFAPAEAEFYPADRESMTVVEVPGISDELCGASRPGHFRGVATVVNRLFNLVQPDVAVLGKKDYQQLFIIRRMVSDLGLPVEIVAADTVREADGLAMSSRNQYLDPEQRKRAPVLYKILCDIASAINAVGVVEPDLAQSAVVELQQAGFKVDYVSIRRQLDLAEAGSGDRELVILAAATLGSTRLIDNLEVRLK